MPEWFFVQKYIAPLSIWDSGAVHFGTLSESQYSHYCDVSAGQSGTLLNDWDYHKGEYDLIYILDVNEPNLLLSEFVIMNGAVKYLDWGDGKHYYCMYDKLPLNESGINEQNYNSLKSLYQPLGP